MSVRTVDIGRNRTIFFDQISCVPILTKCVMCHIRNFLCANIGIVSEGTVCRFLCHIITVATEFFAWVVTRNHLSISPNTVVDSKGFVRDSICIKWIATGHVRIAFALEYFKRVLDNDFSHVVEIHSISEHEQIEFSTLLGVVQSIVKNSVKGRRKTTFTGLDDVVCNVTYCKMLNEHCNEIGLTSCQQHIT